jgi:hypothetical protein
MARFDGQKAELLVCVPQTNVFHVMRNSLIRKTELFAALRAALGSALPASWSLRSAQRGEALPDAAWTLQAPDGSTRNLLVEAKRVVEPRDVPSVLRQLERQAVVTRSAAQIARFGWLRHRPVTTRCHDSAIADLIQLRGSAGDTGSGPATKSGVPVPARKPAKSGFCSSEREVAQGRFCGHVSVEMGHGRHCRDSAQKWSQYPGRVGSEPGLRVDVGR